jgi:competence protein ComEC
LEELFRISGTMHLFAVSGLHVGIVAGILTGVAALLRIPRHFAVILVVPAVLFYAVLTGLSPSAVRAALMLSALLSAYAFREKPRLLNSLGFACLIILLFETRQIFLPGFQLSFSVLLFLALFGTTMRNAIARPFRIDPFLPKSLISPLRHSLDRVSGAFAAALAISLVAWLGSVGILAWHFQNVSTVGVIANLFMVPIASVMIGIASFSLASFGLRLSWLNLAANRINVGIAMALTGLAQYFASLPGATFNTGDFPHLPPGNSGFTLDVMGDRGEGAILITIPRGPGLKPLHWMIDCGSPYTYQNQVLPLLRSRGINRIDALILTHGDQGHIGAAPDLITQFRPALLLEGEVENRSPVHDKIIEAADTFSSRILRVDRGDRIAIGDHAVATILSPSSQKPGRLADDRALVLKLQWEDFSILLTSDTGFDTEQELLQSKTDLRADLWIRGQHSESPGALPGFVDAMKPQAVISSNGEFPKSEQIPASFRKSLQEKGIPLFDLSSCGTTRIEIREGIAHLSGYTSPDSSVSVTAKSQ